eukprot:jgi/Hompol1/5558/HPOL_004561-RA
MSSSAASNVRYLVGEVIGTAMQKTIKVRIERVRLHPVVLKPVRRHRNVFAHDADEVCVVGDWVRIQSCERISKNKNYTLSSIITPAQRYRDEDGELHTQATNVVTRRAIQDYHDQKAKEAERYERIKEFLPNKL